MQVSEIRSIGWLNGVNKNIILTPVMRKTLQIYKVNVTLEEFNTVRGNIKKMMALAVAKFNEKGK